MRRCFVAQDWVKFNKQVIKISASPLQRQELRHAYYAGAQAVLKRLWDALPDGPATGEQVAEGADILKDIYEELQAYAQKIVDGKA